MSHNVNTFYFIFLTLHISMYLRCNNIYESFLFLHDVEKLEFLLKKFKQESHLSREQEKMVFKARQKKNLQKEGLRNLLL